MRLSDFVLRYRQGEGEWQAHPLTSNEVLIGRGEDNDLVLQHREVSRHHLRLSFQDDYFLVTDLESSNGTRVDGTELAPQVPTDIRPGQMIAIGNFTLVLEKVAEGGTHISRELLPFLLRYRFGVGTWQTFPIEPGEKILGRDPECDFTLNDTEVSRRHARLQIANGEIWLTDLGSTNGTKVEDIALEPNQPHLLRLGQPFTIGSFVLQVNEPTRFYKAPTSVSGRAKKERPSKPIAPDEDVPTVFDADAIISEAMPVRAISMMSRERVKIGRASDNDAVLNHPSVNRYHAVIERADLRFRVLDLHSTNGVFVNGERIDRQAYLKDWDQIRIGAFAFVLSGQDLEQQVIPGFKLEAQNLHQQVSRSLNLLQEISLTIRPNELVGIVGTNGSGKTTLLNAFSGYLPASHGRVLVNDIDLYEHYDLFRNDIGYVPQEAIAHAELTPRTALEYVARLRLPPDTTRKERTEAVSKVLEDLDLREQQDMLISQLSEGQLKRVSIGCELLSRPRLFFLDEPTRGLDPDAEYDMVKLLRRLADGGRTVIFSSHANKNVMLCDKVIFLAQGGYLAFYGAPGDALVYFDQFRTDREHSDKEMEFDDIYRILKDETRGSPVEWRERYLSSPIYYLVFGIEPSLMEFQEPGGQQPAPRAGRVRRSTQRVSGLRQFFILSSRNLRILAHDRVSLILMLALAPILGSLDFIWGRDLYDPVKGDVGKIIALWLLGALVTILVGASSSFREIVKEVDIYKRERVVNLKIWPYIFSKIWVGAVLALYQVGALLVFRQFFVNPNMPSLTSYVAMYITLFLGTMTGYLIGLLISAMAPNQSAALILVMIVLVPQFLFAGALFPLDLIPGGRSISVFMPTRWSFESFVRITGLGEQLNEDPCWTGYSKADRLHLPAEIKDSASCPCLGASIFTQCADFPGILSPDFYDEASRVALALPEPVEPSRPSAIPYPTAIPSPTPLPTPTLGPSLTPYPTPRSPSGIPAYMEQIREQGDEYQKIVADQFEQYRLDSVAQAEEYSQIRAVQGDTYANLHQAQEDQYADAMRSYSDDLTEWKESRDKAINSAENLLGYLFDNFRQAFRGSVLGRWVFLILIQVGLLLMIFIAQKRKDAL